MGLLETARRRSSCAAAGELNLSVAVLSLSNRLLSDDALRSLVDALPPATLLLIEDVDCVFKTERITTDQTGVTLERPAQCSRWRQLARGTRAVSDDQSPRPARFRADPAWPGRSQGRAGACVARSGTAALPLVLPGVRPEPSELEGLADRFAAQVPAWQDLYGGNPGTPSPPSPWAGSCGP